MNAIHVHEKRIKVHVHVQLYKTQTRSIKRKHLLICASDIQVCVTDMSSVHVIHGRIYMMYNITCTCIPVCITQYCKHF